MDSEMIQKMRDMFDNMVNAVLTMGKSFGVDSDQLERNIRTDLAKFIMYIAVSDHHISWNEKNLICDVTKLYFETPTDVIQFVVAEKIYDGFNTQIPAAAEILWEYQQRFSNIDQTQKLISSVSDAVFAIYELAGNVAANMEGEATFDQKIFYKEYMDFLNHHLPA